VKTNPGVRIFGQMVDREIQSIKADYVAEVVAHVSVARIAWSVKSGVASGVIRLETRAARRRSREISQRDCAHATASGNATITTSTTTIWTGSIRPPAASNAEKRHKKGDHHMTVSTEPTDTGGRHPLGARAPGDDSLAVIIVVLNQSRDDGRRSH